MLLEARARRIRQAQGRLSRQPAYAGATVNQIVPAWCTSILSARAGSGTERTRGASSYQTPERAGRPVFPAGAERCDWATSALLRRGEPEPPAASGQRHVRTEGAVFLRNSQRCHCLVDGRSQGGQFGAGFKTDPEDARRFRGGKESVAAEMNFAGRWPECGTVRA